MSNRTGYQHELIIPSEDLPFKMFVFEGKDGNYVRDKHWHRSIEIFAVFEGSLSFVLDEEKIPLGAGEFIIVNSNEVHSVFSPKPNFTLVLQIPRSAFKKYFTEDEFILFSHQTRTQDERVMSLLKGMCEVYVKRECGYEFKLQSSFYMLLYLLVTGYRETEVDDAVVRNYKKLNRLSAITAYIRDNYRKELSLESVAGEFGYSSTYLSKMFRKYAKVNYKAYLQSIRVEYAYKDLVGSDKNIGEIAAAHGFPNQKAFAKEFQKKYGMLPSAYRKKLS